MCESAVFVLKGGKKEKVMSEASFVKDDGQKVIVGGMFGEIKEVKGKIIEVDADRHEIIISSDDRTQA